MKKRIKILKELLNEVKVFKDVKKYNYRPKTYKEFKEVLKIKARRKIKDLNDIDVSSLEFVGHFSNFEFFRLNNFFVDEWDVSRVKNFSYCFQNCMFFNSDLSNWDVSNGEKFYSFFFLCYAFNQPVKNFDVTNAKILDSFFHNCEKFNNEIFNFQNNKKVVSLESLFDSCYNFNQDISHWDVSNVEVFDRCFDYTKKFKQDLSKWDTSSAKSWQYVFRKSLMENYPELMPLKFRVDYLK